MFEVVNQCGIVPKVLYKVTLSTAETVLYCIELFPNETSVGSALTESIMKAGRGQRHETELFSSNPGNTGSF